MLATIFALLTDAGAGLFWWGVRWTIMLPFRYRRKKIMEGIEIRNATFTVNGDGCPDLNVHFWIGKHTHATLKIKSLTLCFQSGQWEFARIHVTPAIDGIPHTLRGMKDTQVNIRLVPPLKWWLEYKSNINISKAFLEVATSWGDLGWLVKITECSMDIRGIDGVCEKYLTRIGLKSKMLSTKTKGRKKATKHEL